MRSMPLPLALVEGSIAFSAHAHATHLIIVPIALVPSPITLDISPLSVSFTLTPIADIVRAIWGLAETKTVLLLLVHFTNVYSS